MVGCVKSVSTLYRCIFAESYQEVDIYGDIGVRYANLKSAELCPDFDGNQFCKCSHLVGPCGCCNCERQQRQADEKYKAEQEALHGH